MLMLIVLKLFLLIILSEAVKITTKLGEIEGTEVLSRDGRIYHSFTGIPYAKPPVGKLRLKNPEKAEPWNGVLDATKQVLPCIQVPIFVHYLRNVTFGQEDCLYLNIFIPKVISNKKLPVLVYFHGGGFRCGSPGSKYSAGFLMDEDVVLVTLQYRVGTLGFLSFEDEIIPGNFGLKDQTLALHWIKDNIGDFGGDGNSITIFGESAGGASTHYHMLSPRNKGLLKGVISQSGVANNVWSFAPSGAARSLALQVAKKFGCQNKSGAELLTCFQEVDAVALTRAELDFLFWDFNPGVVFRPIKEPSNPGAFLDFDPLTTETELPWIVGVVAGEGNLVRAALMSQDPSITQQYIDNVEDYIGRILYLEKHIPYRNESIRLIAEKYFSKPYTVLSVQQDIVDFTTDSYFIYPMMLALNRHRGPVYQYLYNYKSSGSHVDVFGPNLNLGTNHADDALLLFNLTERYPKANSPKDIEPSKNLVKMWVNFAKNSNPSTDEISWPELNQFPGLYLNFSTQMDFGRYLKQDVMKWWDNLPMFKSTSAPIKTEL